MKSDYGYPYYKVAKLYTKFRKEQNSPKCYGFSCNQRGTCRFKLRKYILEHFSLGRKTVDVLHVRVDVQSQHLGSNPHGCRFMLLCIIEDRSLLILIQFILEDRAWCTIKRKKILILMLKILFTSLAGVDVGEVNLSPNFKVLTSMDGG